MKLSHTIKTSFKIFLAAFSIYVLSWLFVFSTGINSTLIPSEDALPATWLPVSIINEGNFYLDDAAPFLIQKYPNPDDKMAVPFYLRLINGHYVSGFPVVTPLLAVPVYILPILITSPPPSSVLIPIMAKLAAAVIASLSIVVVYLTLRELLKEQSALLLALLYAFATSTFALSSQGLWQHGPAQLLLSLAIYFLVRAEKNSSLVPYSALFLSLATLARPTSFLPAVLLTLYVLYRHPRRIISYTILALLPLIPWVIYNNVYFGSFLANAYSTGVGVEGNWTGKFPEGFLGIWLSPSKGLLVYSPIFLFSLLGAVQVFWDKNLMGSLNLLFRVLAVTVVAFTLMMGKWYHWFGGWSFSYRMAVDITPLLILLLVPLVKRGLSQVARRIFIATIIWSLAIQLVGIAFYDGEWHARFDDGPGDTRWLWSIKNSELVYYGRKINCRLRSENDIEYWRCQGFKKINYDEGK